MSKVQSFNDSEKNDTKNNDTKNNDTQTRTYITKHGTKAKMNTTNIGKSKVEEPETNLSEDNPDRDPDSTKNDDGGFIPEDNYPEDNHYYPEDVIKDLWDDDEDSFSESLNESVSEDSVKEDSVSKSKSSNVKKTKKPKLEKPQRPQKKEIVIKEGLNYFIRESEDKCRWYVELDQEIYQGLKIYQDRVQAMSVNAAIMRFLENEGILLRPFPENKIIDEKPSPINSLNSETRNKLENIVEKHGVDTIFKMFP